MLIWTLWEDGRGIQAENITVLCWLEGDIRDVPPLTGSRLRTGGPASARQPGDNRMGCLENVYRKVVLEREVPSSR